MQYQAAEKRKNVAEEIMSFLFEQPGRFEYRAGQFEAYTLIKPPETGTKGKLEEWIE